MDDELEKDGPNWSGVREALEELKADVEKEHDQNELRDYQETLYDLEQALADYDHAVQTYYIQQGDYSRDGDG